MMMYIQNMTQHVRVQEFQTEKFFYKSVYTRTHKHPAGGKTAPAFWAFWKKKCRFRHSETADSFPKMVLKIPGILKWFFNDDL